MYSPTLSCNEYLQEEQLKYPELTRDAIETLKQSLVNDNLPFITGESLFFRNPFVCFICRARHEL